MRQIAFLAVCLAYSTCHAEEDYFAPLQGVWFGTKDVYRVVLVISGDKMLFIHPTGAKISTFQVNANEIDIDRYDGTEQFGLYRADAAWLVLTLADPGLPVRPLAVGANANREGDVDTAIFTRTMTDSALTTLQVITRNSVEQCLDSTKDSVTQNIRYWRSKFPSFLQMVP